jgi:hypothetical protein
MVPKYDGLDISAARDSYLAAGGKADEAPLHATVEWYWRMAAGLWRRNAEQLIKEIRYLRHRFEEALKTGKAEAVFEQVTCAKCKRWVLRRMVRGSAGGDPLCPECWEVVNG